MTCCFKGLADPSGLTDDNIAAILWFLSVISCYSVKDGCYVVAVSCAECGLVYEEECDEAIVKVSARERFLCLGCDNPSEKEVLLPDWREG